MTDGDAPKAAPKATRRKALTTSKTAESTSPLSSAIETLARKQTAEIAAHNRQRLVEYEAVSSARKLPEHTVAANFRGAYVVTASMLRSLEAQWLGLLPDSKLDVTATFVGDYSISFPGGVEEFLSTPTLETRKLQKLSMTMHQFETPPLAKVRFYIDGESSTPGRLDVSARDRALVTDIDRLVRDEMSAKSQGYGFLYSWQFNLAYILFMGFGVGIILQNVGLPAGAALVLSVAVGPGGLAAYWVLRYALFRRVEFALGRSEQLADNRRTWRTRVFGGFVVAILIGIISELGANAISDGFRGFAAEPPPSTVGNTPER